MRQESKYKIWIHFEQYFRYITKDTDRYYVQTDKDLALT